jgi:NADH pyrophosphatase NudC (nudix superfamily)
MSDCIDKETVRKILSGVCCIRGCSCKPGGYCSRNPHLCRTCKGENLHRNGGSCVYPVCCWCGLENAHDNTNCSIMHCLIDRWGSYVPELRKNAATVIRWLKSRSETDESIKLMLPGVFDAYLNPPSSMSLPICCGVVPTYPGAKFCTECGTKYPTTGDLVGSFQNLPITNNATQTLTQPIQAAHSSSSHTQQNQVVRAPTQQTHTNASTSAAIRNIKPKPYGVVNAVSMTIVAYVNGEMYVLVGVNADRKNISSNGGYTNRGEDARDAAIREQGEESGVAVKNPVCFKASSSFAAFVVSVEDCRFNTVLDDDGLPSDLHEIAESNLVRDFGNDVARVSPALRHYWMKLAFICNQLDNLRFHQYFVKNCIALQNQL